MNPHLDLPSFTNAGGLVLFLLLLLVALLAFANRPPRCHRCGRRLGRHEARLTPYSGDLPVTCIPCYQETFR